MRECDLLKIKRLMLRILQHNNPLGVARDATSKDPLMLKLEIDSSSITNK